MFRPLDVPGNKDPLERTRQVTLPPQARSRQAHMLAQAAAEGRFALLQCRSCGTFVAPAHDCCPVCLAGEFSLGDAATGGTVLSLTEAEVPFLTYFRERAPWRVALVRLDCGPIVLAHAHYGCEESGKVTMSLKLDKAGQAVFYAAPEGSEATYMDDPQWREMTADPRHRRILITDGRNPVTPALVKDLLKAGARKVFVGVPDDWKPFPAGDELIQLKKVKLVPLDVRSERSVFELSHAYAAKTEILINTTDHIRPGGYLAPGQLSHTAEAMDVVAMGLMRLATRFAPIMAARGADGDTGAAAWVNVLSVYAQTPSAVFAGYSMAHAAALNLSHSLRAELRQGGIRMMNVLTGASESEWLQTMPQPRVTARVLSRSIVDGLKRGLEDVHVGAVAQDIHERLLSNPKAAEREIAATRPGG
ncbi:SDR family NAD(P)-dependent oxidoreductase [Pukyongiella litopenaei]|uniref:SDR family NAD(P)-dependent oxidoreductase n=1 Tax=Pukyongiella litopenaei TaxID=2605946 RepID=A0A5C2H6Y9_9RHOB|nr:SDR family NAD(P)-dependent oxidoreductase [Pukyongiella litopenaei]QEP30453.1 SDR family NAD(P)-dependent oxidoreductase [Pukyongiella litopenaei]